MKYCKECGFGCDDLARFCNICGYQFKIDAVKMDVADQAVEELDDEATTLLLEEAVEENVQRELDKLLADDTPEYYKREMLQNKQMIDDLMKQQQQLQMQLDTMKKQQWQQAELQQKQQNQLKEYKNQGTPQPIIIQPQNAGNHLRNKWALIAAIVCIISFVMGNFVVYKWHGNDIPYGIIEFCQRIKATGYYSNIAELMVIWMAAALPILAIGLTIVLVVSAFCAIPVVRLWVVIANIIGMFATFVYILMEGGGDYAIGFSFWCLAIGMGMGAYSCTKEVSKSGMQVANALDFNLKHMASEVPLERDKEWRCPKCDTRNSNEYKFCKTCGTSKS